MIFDWYNLFSLTDFMATGLVSRTLTVLLDGRGEKSVLITRGNEVSLMFEDTFLPVEFNGQNPYVREGSDGTYGVFIDDDDHVWLGIEVPE